MAIWNIFRIPPLDVPTCYILDEAGMWKIDKHYRDTGLSEGWLELDGFYKLNDKLIFYYRLI